MMILYNTIVGLAAGVALVLVARLFKQLAKSEKVPAEGHALSFGMTGFILIGSVQLGSRRVGSAS